MKVTKQYTIEELNSLSVQVAKKKAIAQGIPRTPHPRSSELTHPICITPDCNNPKTINDWHWTSGLPVYKDICIKCHNKAVAGKHGLKSISQVVVKNAGFNKESELLNHRAKKKGFASHYDQLDHKAKEEGFASHYDKMDHQAMQKGFASYIDMLEHQAREEGFTSLTDKRNSKHPFRKWRKDYCENIDNRLEGGACTTTIPIIDGVLFVGMLDVDHIDGNPKNNAQSNAQTLCKCCHAYKTIKFKDYETPGRGALKKEQQLLTQQEYLKAKIFFSVAK